MPRKRTQLPRLLKYSEGLFDGTFRDWGTEPVDLKINPGSKPFNSNYYMVPRINSETFCKDRKCIVKTGVLTPVQ